MSEPTTQKIRLWRDELQDPLAPPRKPSRAGWIFLVVAVLLGLGGLFVGILFWIRPAPAPLFVPLWVTHYDAVQIRDVPHAAGDRQALGNKHFFHNEKTGISASPQGHQILATLRELEDHSQPVVIYLCAQALRSGGKGEIFLLPADTQPDNPATFIPLQEVLNLLKKCPSTNKLLILDISHANLGPRLGSLSNDVAEAIPAVVTENNDPDLLVLTSCSPGQVALQSEAMGRSVFGFYLEQGLRGWADGFLDPRWKEGRISVKELAAYVQEKVDRWAQLNAETRQSPMLLGKGKNFLLRAFADSDREEAVQLPPMPEYPKWLQEAWKTAHSNYTSNNYRLTPYLFEHQTALLVQAEQLWRGGTSVESIQGRELVTFTQVQKILPQKRLFAQPQPYSLALSLKLQGKTPLDLNKELDTLLTDWKKAGDEAKPEQVKEARDKLVVGFLTKQKDKEFVPLAWALFNKAAALEAPTRDEILLLDSLIQSAATEKKPQHLETLLLHQLAKVAEAKKTTWSAGTVALLLQAAAFGEQASGSLRAFPWNKELLEMAAQVRHDGDIRFWGKDYTSLGEANQFLAKAVSSQQAILTNTNLVEAAHATRDEAMFFLPAYLPYLANHTEQEAVWREAIQASVLLNQGLLERTENPALVGIKLKELSPHIATVRQKLDQLRQPFSSGEVKHLIAVSKEPLAKSGVRLEIDALLATPFVTPDERVSLWKAGLELSRRLQQKTLELDDEDHRAGQLAGQPLLYDAEKFLTLEKSQGQRQAQAMLELFRLGGLNEDSLARLDKASAPLAAGKGTEADWYKLATLIQNAWVKELRDQYQDEITPAARDRLIRILPPLDGPPGLQAEQPSDAALVLFQDGKQLWSWLALQHQYLARDYQGSGLDTPAAKALGEFHAKAASAYQQLAPPKTEQYIQLIPGKDIPLLLPQRTTAASELAVKIVGVKNQELPGPVPLELQPPGKDWLHLTPKSLLLTKLTPDPASASIFTQIVPFEVKLLDGAALSPYPAPLGFLAEARLGSKSFHHAIKVPMRSTNDQLQIILSPNPKLPDPPLDSLRLRPGKSQQKFFVHVYNPGTEPKKIIAQLLAKDEVLKGGEVVLTVGPKKTEWIPFGGIAAPPKDAPPKEEPPKEGAAPKEGGPVLPKLFLPPLKNKLAIRVLDAEDKELVLASQKLEVAIAHPREYVTVSKVLFDPAAPRNLEKNQLSVTLEPLTTVAGPDIPAELILPLDRIPSLLLAKDGMFKGNLNPTATEPPPKLTLFAKEMQLNELAEPEGYFYVHVDGWQRCFIYRTTFSRDGDPLTPKLMLQPEVRFATKAFVQSSAKFAITVETNNAPDNSSLLVVLGREEAGKFLTDVKETYKTPKNRQIGFALEGGGLLFEASVEDWQVPIDTSQIRGKRILQATLRDEFGKVLAYREQVLVIDDTPPENVKFVKYPAKAQKGTKALVRAAGNDSESGIQEVVFFVGGLEGGKIPPKTALTPGKQVGTKAGLTWEAELPLPETKGTTEITVVMTNKVGLINYDTVKIDLMDTDPATTGPGSIKGKVLFGELPQQNLDVFLYDEKDLKKGAIDKTTTDKDGNYEFKNLKPGNYTVYSINKGSKRTGYEKAAVVANKVTELNIGLKLK